MQKTYIINLEVNKMEFKDRLKNWLKDNNIKQIDIANKANVNKSYISNVIAGRVPPSENLVNFLSEISGHSIHWWLFGKEEYDNLNSLNETINLLIKLGKIDSNGNYSEDIKEMLINLMNDEIKDKLEDIKKAQGN
jgi:transcriptional regulator with XRE-family HTH domain